MPSTSDSEALNSSSTSQSSQSAGRRLLSKFASGLNTKPRSVAEFYIELEENHRQYSNGDRVKGSVRLKVLKPVRITHIVISLSGHAHVYKNPTTPGETPRTPVLSVGNGKSKTSGQYHGNGFATLFEDEVVLCGDGRLADGQYQFNFDLGFPKRDLPSSIDFERGRVSYTITATLTRPTTISPIINFDRSVVFLERIDISKLAMPKPRTVTLDPVSKRSKAKSQALKLIDQPDRKSQYFHTTSSTDGLPDSNTSQRPSASSNEVDRPLSPVPSEMSTETGVSGCNVLSSHNGSTSPTASVAPRQHISKATQNGKTISTIIAPCAGGCLRGDHLQVKLTVNHTKYMKSMSGVIVTLYRHARVDTQPLLSIGPLDTKASKVDAYITKSVTGLGGLSMSGAGTAHVFRKDMAQVVLPLVINPSTLTAEMVAKLRVPEEAFPTIAGVPGAMISFRYHVEVIVDIQGRLSAQDRALTSIGQLTGNNSGAVDQSDVDWSATTNYGARILDTSSIRRDKGLVCTSFEVIIGTMDSERRKGKKKAAVVDPQTQHSAQQYDGINTPSPTIPTDPPTFDSIRSTSAYRPQQEQTSGREHAFTNGNGVHQPEPLFMPPTLPDEMQMSEKERIRLAETRLLPSQPPEQDDQSHNTAQASAPHLDNGQILAPSAPQDEYAEAGPSCHPHTEHVNGESQDIPAYQHAESAHAGASATDDKQELERSRLQAQASAPPIDEVESEQAGPSAPTPSAPALSYDESTTNQHDSHADASEASDLPRYER